MRTTITLDPEIEQLIRDTMQKTRKSFKEVVNQALYNELSKGKQSEEEPFRIHARPLNLRTGIGAADFNKLADDMEIEAFTEAAENPEKPYDNS
jgi:hypothetical protein